MEISFSKSKLAMTQKVSELYGKEMKLTTGFVNDDFIKELFTLHLESFVLSRLLEKQILVEYKAPQKFIDWLLRRPQKFVFVFECKEILKNPPALPPNQSQLFYEVKPL